MPIDLITLEVDLAMTALLLHALDSSAGAALVLAHVLRRAPLDHPFAKELSVSWLMLNLPRALNGRGHATEIAHEPGLRHHRVRRMHALLVQRGDLR